MTGKTSQSAMGGVVVEVVRNGFVESRHQGRLVALDRDGEVAFAAGDVASAMFPRSSLKPVQTVAMLGAGWQPDDLEQVALACASHSGEPRHLDVVRRILSSAGLDEKALDNVADLPLDATAARAFVRGGGEPDALHQNCSGKHAAMLATCVANGWPTAGYRSPGHPLQHAIRTTVERLCGEAVAAVAVDGCGAPLFAVSLTGLASAFRAVGTAAEGSPESVVRQAMADHAWLVGGTGRDVTRLMESVPGLIAKDGAEGVFAAALSDGRAVAVKIEDGAFRARMPLLVAALGRLGVDEAGLTTLAEVPVFGHGEPVGVVRVAAPYE